MAQHALVQRRTARTGGFVKRVVAPLRWMIYNVRRRRSGILITSGLGCMNASAYMLNMALGLLVTGIVLLVIEISTGEEQK